MRQLNTAHRGHNHSEGDIMLIVMGKNGSVQLLLDGQPATPSVPELEERERRYALIERRLQEEFGLEEISPTPARSSSS
jgi:hypothetical protein